MARFSSRSTLTTFSRCRPQVLPTSVQTGAKESTSARNAASSSAGTPRRRVMPKAHTSARSPSCSSRSNSSASFGFEAGKPASMKGMPRSSSTCATRTFSSTDSDMPWPCMPSRRVVS